MRMNKTILCLFTMTLCTAFTRADNTAVTYTDLSGIAGDSATFYFEARTGRLYLYGSGVVDRKLSDSIGYSNLTNEVDTLIVSDSITDITGFKMANSAIKSAYLGGVTILRSYMFDACLNLRTLDMPNVRVIEDRAAMAYILPQDGAVNYSSSLTSVTWSDSLKSIGYGAFMGHYGVKWKSKFFPEGIESIGGGAFQAAKLPDTITFPASLKSVGSGLFVRSSRGFIRWNIPDFDNQSNILLDGWGMYYTGIAFGDSVRRVPDKLCSGANRMTSITFAPTVQEIGNNAFYNCKAVTTIVLPDSLQKIGSNAFQNCTGLTEITIPAKVGGVSAYAFNGCTALSRVIFPKGLNSIGDNAFSDCPLLDSLVFPDGVRSIGASAFFNDTMPTELVLPKNLVVANEQAFSGWKHLRKITIPNSVIMLGDYCFAGDSVVDTIRCYTAQPPIIYEHTLDGIDNTAVLLVPQGCAPLYQQHEYWGRLTVTEMNPSETVQNTVTVDPTDNTAYFTWPTDERADTYVLDIRKDGEIFCHLTFGAYGQLLSITFAAPARRSATADNRSLSFMVTGLTNATRYSYTVATLGKDEQVLHVYKGEFATWGYDGTIEPDGTEVTPTPPVVPYEPYSTALDNISFDYQDTQCIFHEGQIVILKGNHLYNLNGTLIQ